MKSIALIASFAAATLLGGGPALANVVNCGQVKYKDKISTIYTGRPNNNGSIDDKVYDCPSGYSWESCCAICGQTLQSMGAIRRGWGCHKGGALGIWIRSCDKDGTCEDGQ